jgi:G:T-mismatch repair DNA endonuclease (very short patch repair protein)
LECGKIVPQGSIYHHLRSYHNLSVNEYRLKFNIPQRSNHGRGKPWLGKISNNRKYTDLETEIECSICGNKFRIPTRRYQYRLRIGKSRFACSFACIKKLKSITIKEVRGTLESRAKTHEQLVKRWANPSAREKHSSIMKAKPQEWHTKRLAKTLKTCLSGKQTKPELLVQKFIEENKLPFKYVGDGSFSVGPLFPDFVDTNGSKIVILVQGCYWHGCAKCFPGSKARGLSHNLCLHTYANNGYRAIEIWEHDLKDPLWQRSLLSKLSSYLGNINT